MVIPGATSGAVTLSVPATITSYPIVLPSAQGAFSTILINDGAGNLSWGSASGIIGVGTIDSQPKSADGASISGSALYMQTADATHPGLISTGTQSIPGSKTFLEPIIINSDVQYAHTRYVPVGALSGSNPAWETGFRTGNPYYSIVMDDGSTKTTFVDFGLNGVIMMSSPIILSSDNMRAGNIATIGGDTAIDLTVSGAAITIGRPADLIQLKVQGNGTQTSDLLEVVKSDTTVLFKVTNAGAGTFTGAIAASNFSGSSSGTNTGDVTLTAVGSTPSANGASLSGQALTLQPADGTHPGVLTEVAQTIGGVKTFSSAPIFSSVSASQALIVDGSKQLSSLGYGSANVASTLVERDASGNFAAGTITASLTGNATTATTATNATNIATTQVSTNASFFPLFVASSTNGNQAADLGTGLTFNPSTNTMSTTTFAGALTGTASGNTTISGQTNHGVVVASATNAMTSTGAGSAGQVLTSNGASSDPTFQTFTPTYTAPNVTVYTSGTGTFTKTGSPLYLRVRLVGGGGGGGGGGTSSPGTGGNGGNSTFGTTLLAGNGGNGGANNGNATAGGTASLGSGPVGLAITGGLGFCSAQQSSNTVYLYGGAGGNSPFGGNGSPGGNGFNATGPVSNTGSGGGGGGMNLATGSSGAGGSAGGYVDAIISSPSSTYSYAVGAAGSAGSAGTNGTAGAAGAAGIIIVEEFYQ